MTEQYTTAPDEEHCTQSTIDRRPQPTHPLHYVPGAATMQIPKDQLMTLNRPFTGSVYHSESADLVVIMMPGDSRVTVLGEFPSDEQLSRLDADLARFAAPDAATQ